MTVDLELQSDLIFSRHDLKLDLLRAKQRSTKPVPAIVHLHGGAGVMFGKYAVDNQFLARQGYVTVSIDYRLAGEALFPAQVHDVKTAVRWLRAHASELMIDPSRIGVWGISAGGHLAGWLGTSSGVGELEGEDGGWADQDSSVQAVASVCGPMLFNEPSWIHGERPFPLFGERISDVPETAALGSPLTHISPSTPLSRLCMVSKTQWFLLSSHA